MKNPLQVLARAWFSILAWAVVTVVLTSAAFAQGGGLPPYSSLRSWNAAQPTYGYAGAKIDTSKMKLDWSARAQPGGICDVGPNDINSNNSKGQHTWYGRFGSYGPVGGYDYNPASPINPVSCPGGNLQLRMGYDPANSRWYGWEVDTGSTYYQGNEGYVAPSYGFYMESTITLPTSVPAGLCPWLAEVWSNNGAGFPYLGATGTGFEGDGVEHCLNRPANATSTSFSYLLTSTLHEAPPNTPQIGQITATRQKNFASKVYVRNLADGQSHRYGQLYTLNWVIFFIDGVEVSRVAKTGQEQNQGSFNFRISNGVYTAPTADLSTTFDVLITDAKVYLCVPLSACPVG